MQVREIALNQQTIIAMRVARELREGMLVNLGIGIPTVVANHLPQGIQVFFQSANCLIGACAIPDEGMAYPLLTDAGLEVDQAGRLTDWMIPGRMVPGMGGAMNSAAAQSASSLPWSTARGGNPS